VGNGNTFWPPEYSPIVVRLHQLDVIRVELALRQGLRPVGGRKVKKS